MFCRLCSQHPKQDPETGEWIIYSYETKGEGTPDVKYFLFSEDGKKLEELEFKAPYAGLMHDIGITPNYVVFQIYPLVCDAERVKRGGNHWVYDEKLPMYLCRESLKAQNETSAKSANSTAA